MASHPVPPDPASPILSGTGVRRHHTISAHSRTARASAKDIVISEESHPHEQLQQQQQHGQKQATQTQHIWNTDEVVDNDWVGGVGAVGEKSSLHRQASLPTRYHRGFTNQAPRSGTQTPVPVNSLAAITGGNEGDEEPWKYVASYRVDDDEPASDPTSPQIPQTIEDDRLSPHPHAHGPSPPPAASGVRRHVSLTYGPGVSGNRKVANTGLKRSGTLQAPNPHHHPQTSSSPEVSEHVDEDQYSYEYESEDQQQAASYYEDEYFRQQAQQQQQAYGSSATGSIGRQSTWSANDWTAFGGNGNPGGAGALDDVQRALSALEIASTHPHHHMQQQQGYGAYSPAAQGTHPPRFNSTPSVHQQTGSRGGGDGYGNGNGNKYPSDGRSKTPQSQQRERGLSGASAPGDQGRLRRQTSNTSMHMQYQHSKSGSSGSGVGGTVTPGGPGSGVPSVPPIPQQYLSQAGSSQPQGNGAGRAGLGVATNFAPNSPSIMPSGQTPVQGFVNTPVDVPSLIATKGYNPANFDTRPAFARYFVIKSYTEDDVHKSLKYEIWSSTDPGNKRLDKAFKEVGGRGPIYLFFSVNASGHFCGMAEMLTPVDYTRSSTVWASDKWKGVFKVRWIFVRDIPNAGLRHIKLNNTQERKPVTNSRDTQELLPDAGQEMLRIFHSHPARTSLLQDFAFYELQAMQKMQASGTSSPPVLYTPQLSSATLGSPPQGQLQGGQGGYNPLAYSPQMMMGIGHGQGQGNGGYGTHGGLGMQGLHQSVMRNPSPAPPPPGAGQPVNVVGQQAQNYATAY